MRALRLFAPVAVAAVLLAGCGPQNDSPGGATTTPTATAPSANGIADLAASEIVTKAVQALTAAKSVRVKGDITQDSEKITLDIKTNGTDASGTLHLSGSTLELIKIGDTLYFKGDDSFWRNMGGTAGDTFAAMFKGKWAKTSATAAQFADLAKFAQPSAFFEDAPKDLAKGETITINGVPAIALSDASKEGTLYVATTGQPYPLRLAGKPGEGAIDFTEFGATFDIQAPPETDVLDIDKLIGK